MNDLDPWAVLDPTPLRTILARAAAAVAVLAAVAIAVVCLGWWAL